jgi:hypothetical protein
MTSSLIEIMPARMVDDAQEMLVTVGITGKDRGSARWPRACSVALSHCCGGEKLANRDPVLSGLELV